MIKEPTNIQVNRTLLTYLHKMTAMITNHNKVESLPTCNMLSNLQISNSPITNHERNHRIQSKKHLI